MPATDEGTRLRLTPGKMQDLLFEVYKDSHPRTDLDPGDEITRDHYKVLSGIQDKDSHGADFWIFVEVGSDRQFGVYSNDFDLTTIFDFKECASNHRVRELY